MATLNGSAEWKGDLSAILSGEGHTPDSVRAQARSRALAGVPEIELTVG